MYPKIAVESVNSVEFIISKMYYSATKNCNNKIVFLERESTNFQTFINVDKNYIVRRTGSIRVSRDIRGLYQFRWVHYWVNILFDCKMLQQNNCLSPTRIDRRSNIHHVDQKYIVKSMGSIHVYGDIRRIHRSRKNSLLEPLSAPSINTSNKKSICLERDSTHCQTFVRFC